MSDLTNWEKRKFERLFKMETGYVLDFTNQTFEEFVQDSVGRNIYDTRYASRGSSKANRLRQFWIVEANGVVAKVMGDLLDHCAEVEGSQMDSPLLLGCRKTVARLSQASTVSELDSIVELSTERDFEAVARSIRDTIENNQPEVGLDRLHTFVTKYVRSLCTRQGIVVVQEKPLHSVFGEYVKRLRDSGHLESEMALRILKSSISVLEAFNDVRNNRSLAHDNPILNHDEALLIFNHVASTIRFIRSIEARIVKDQPSFELPF